MRSRTSARWMASGACAAALAAFATLASGIPIQPNPAFHYTLASGANAVAHQAAPGVTAALCVKPATGVTKVKTGATNLGMVPMGWACVLEGPFTSVNVHAEAAATSGDVEVRLTANPDPDRLLGAGTLAFPVSDATFSPYGAFNAAGGPAVLNRLLAINLTGNADSARVTSTGGVPGPAYVVDSGDWGFCSRGITKFSVTGKNAVPFQVFDPTPTGTACSGVMRAQAADDVDSISVDGLRKLEVTLTNNGSGTVTIVYRIGAEQPVTVPVEPGATSPAITGALTQFQWTYQAAGCTVSVAIKGAN